MSEILLSVQQQQGQWRKWWDRNQSDFNDDDDDPPTATASSSKTGASSQQQQQPYRRVQWYKRYKELVRYNDEHGDTDVPSDHTSLGRWVHHQRQQFQHMAEGQSSWMTFERIAALNELGFAWHVDPPEKKAWYARLDELRRYKEAHDGSVNVPLYEEPNAPLGRWVASQREEGRKFMEGHPTLMTVERIQALNELGFWGKQRANPPKGSPAKSGTEAADAEQWNKRLEELRRYKARHGNCNVPGKYGPNPYLGGWVALQRQKYHSMKKDRKYYKEFGSEAAMTPEQVEKLNELGFEWALKATWKDRFEDLCAYKEKYGNTTVPSDYKPDRALGKWVGKQRVEYYRMQQGRSVSLNEERIQKLNGIGFVWKLRNRQTWDEYLQNLREYKDEHGDCDVPRDYKPNPPLSHWINRQRKQYRRMQEGKPSNITEERVAALEEIGFLWRSKRAPLSAGRPKKLNKFDGDRTASP